MTNTQERLREILDSNICHYYGYHKGWTPEEYQEFLTDFKDEISALVRESLPKDRDYKYPDFVNSEARLRGDGYNQALADIRKEWE